MLAADMGFIYYIENDVILFDFIIQNFGVKSKKKDLQSLNFKLGASRYLLDSFLISVEVMLFPYNNKIFPAVGVAICEWYKQ
ncbi:hypothetical protein AGMMS49573_09040 [Endomicrobiia bacterium]|nr:hypothetical protein AGMMS49523_09700 [Endomicrobiia bacterium]GHT12992.1 hypothetical protein AGMMS49571_05940 [Endomicrobiia bacterium]GHT17349.1 hypothetical protein AGMMS49573_09040 [Endomicrobiia bacterium]GHT18589.1 hypothetical protein AGMMS49929_00570 [Endomicrobiia bacterium]GHT28764.1 hypothetical protein AGMMS49995_10140 [Endomicrobiia bacterium]